MRELSNTAGSISFGETSWEAGDSSEVFTGKEYKELIKQANSVPLLKILRHYGVRVDEVNIKAICPFKSHKGGRENTPSFNYFHSTNSFFCYGCRTGSEKSHGCEFVSAMDGISRAKAASKILSLFNNEVSDDLYEATLSTINYSELLEIKLDFSNCVRNFRQNNDSESAFNFIESICAIYDKHYFKHNPNNETLKTIVAELKKRVSYYKI